MNNCRTDHIPAIDSMRSLLEARLDL